ncbi:hypothetical protein C8R48DRAFT_676381 [Suillus tomentosus]|nr:hypothetical protein C8R48DRAFT_676381 [Suillus tomentosus]
MRFVPGSNIINFESWIEMVFSKLWFSWYLILYSRSYEISGTSIMEPLISITVYCSCLNALLKRHVHEEVQEVRGFMDLLDDYQSDITMENSEGCDSTVNVSTPKLDSMAPILDRSGITVRGYSRLIAHGARSCADYIINQPQYTMYSAGIPAFSDPRVTESSLESLHSTSDPIYESTAQPFQGSHFGEHDPFECPWDGCPAVINKDSLTCHVEEVYEWKIKAVWDAGICLQGHLGGRKRSVDVGLTWLPMTTAHKIVGRELVSWNQPHRVGYSDWTPGRSGDGPWPLCMNRQLYLDPCVTMPLQLFPRNVT